MVDRLLGYNRKLTNVEHPDISQEWHPKCQVDCRDALQGKSVGNIMFPIRNKSMGINEAGEIQSHLFTSPFICYSYL